MYDRLLALYLSGRLNDAGLDNAIDKGWITNEQATEIRAAAADDEIVDRLVVDALTN